MNIGSNCHDIVVVFTNQQPSQCGSAVPDPVWVGSKWLLDFPRVPVTLGTLLHFLLCCPLNDCRRAAHSFLEIGHLFFLLLFFCPSSSPYSSSLDAHSNPGPIFPCSVCAGNVTWQGKSVQCCTCSKWVYLRCSQLSLSKFKTLDSSHSWSCPPAVFPLITLTLSSDSSDMYTSAVQSSHLSANAALPPPPHFQTSYPSSSHSVSSRSAPSPPSLAPGCPPTPPASSLLDPLMVLQWNAGGLRARSTELLHFLSSHSVELTCIEESNLNSSSSFQIPGFSALHSDHTHFWSGISSPDTMHASSDVIIFIRQGLSFSVLSTFFFA